MKKEKATPEMMKFFKNLLLVKKDILDLASKYENVWEEYPKLADEISDIYDKLDSTIKEAEE